MILILIEFSKIYCFILVYTSWNSLFQVFFKCFILIIIINKTIKQLNNKLIEFDFKRVLYKINSYTNLTS